MSGQFEQPKDADDGEELKDVCVLQMGGHSLKDQIDVEAQRGHVIDDVDTVRKYIELRTMTLYPKCIRVHMF